MTEIFQKIRTYSSDCYRGVPEEEELIETGDNDCPKESNGPGTDRHDGHVGVIRVGDGGTNLRIRGVILCGVAEYLEHCHGYRTATYPGARHLNRGSGHRTQRRGRAQD